MLLKILTINIKNLINILTKSAQIILFHYYFLHFYLLLIIYCYFSLFALQILLFYFYNVISAILTFIFPFILF